jgi:hypothetical protein
MLKWVYGLVFLVALFAAPPVWAGDGIPDNCENRDGAYYSLHLFPRYNRDTKQLLLVDWTTGKITKTLETDLKAYHFQVGSWSPDCRYFSAARGSYGLENVISQGIWDVVAGQRVITNFFVKGWSLDSQIALLCGANGKGMFWKQYLNMKIDIEVIQNQFGYTDFYCYAPNRNLYWDLDRNQLLIT